MEAARLRGKIARRTDATGQLARQHVIRTIGAMILPFPAFSPFLGLVMARGLCSHSPSLAVSTHTDPWRARPVFCKSGSVHVTPCRRVFARHLHTGVHTGCGCKGQWRAGRRKEEEEWLWRRRCELPQWEMPPDPASVCEGPPACGESHLRNS